MITTTRFPRKRSTIIHSFPRKKKKETSQIERFILDTIKRLWKFSQFLITDRYEDRVYEIRPPNLEIHWSHDAKSGQRSTNPAFTCRRSDKYSTRSMRSHRSRFLSKTVWNRHQREPRPTEEYVSQKESRLTRETRRNAEAEVACLPARTLLFGEPIGLSPVTGVHRVSIGQGREVSTRPETIHGEKKRRRVSTRMNQGLDDTHTVCVA